MVMTTIEVETNIATTMVTTVRDGTPMAITRATTRATTRAKTRATGMAAHSGIISSITDINRQWTTAVRKGGQTGLPNDNT